MAVEAPTSPPSAAAGADFASLFEFLPIGAYRSSADGRQLRANPALVALNGYASEAEMLAAVGDIGIEWYVDPQRRDAFRRQLADAGRVVGFESEIYRHRTRDRIWVSENAHAVCDAQGRLLFYEGTVEEITDRVRSREALRESQDQLRQILELVPGMVYRLVVAPDGQTRATFVSPGIRSVYGVEPGDLLGDGTLLKRMRHPDDCERVDAESAASIAQGRPLHIEFRILLAGGEVRWVVVDSAPAPADAEGNPVRVGTIFDISARKRAEQALLDNSELWKRALESTGDGVWDWNVQTGVEVVSPQLQALYGYADGELADSPDALD